VRKDLGASWPGILIIVGFLLIFGRNIDTSKDLKNENVSRGENKKET
jgi:hypothetical protein